MFRQGNRNSGTVWSGMLVYGVVWLITLLDTYIMICIGMRNLVGNRKHLKLQQMITHLC